MSDTSARRIPVLAVLSSVLRWDWRESYVVLVAFVIPGVLLVHAPVLVPVVFVGLVVVGVGIRIRSVAAWWPLLRAGHVVTPDRVDIGSTSSGTARVSHATGWRVQRGWFTGDLSDNVITYTVGENQRTLTFTGLPYTSGIVLADVSKALCVSELPFDLRPGEGRWDVSVPRSFWPGACATAALYAGLAFGAVWSAG